MRAQSLKGWPAVIPGAIPGPLRQKLGVIKPLTSPPRPDEKTIRQLNALAAKPPFCGLHRVKKHDML
jgi:hypothetical protein